MATEEATDGISLGERLRPPSWRVGATAVVFGVLAGILGAWATTTLGISNWGFLVVGLVTGVHLWRKSLATEAIGSGLYISAVVLFLTPPVYSVPKILGPTPQTVDGATQFIGNLIGLVIVGVVFTLAAIVAAAIGYLFKRWAAKKRSE